MCVSHDRVLIKSGQKAIVKKKYIKYAKVRAGDPQRKLSAPARHSAGQALHVCFAEVAVCSDSALVVLSFVGNVPTNFSPPRSSPEFRSARVRDPHADAFVQVIVFLDIKVAQW